MKLKKSVSSREEEKENVKDMEIATLHEQINKLVKDMVSVKAVVEAREDSILQLEKSLKRQSKCTETARLQLKNLVKDHEL